MTPKQRRKLYAMLVWERIKRSGRSHVTVKPGRRHAYGSDRHPLGNYDPAQLKKFG